MRVLVFWRRGWEIAGGDMHRRARHVPSTRTTDQEDRDVTPEARDRPPSARATPGLGYAGTAPTGGHPANRRDTRCCVAAARLNRHVPSGA